MSSKFDTSCKTDEKLTNFPLFFRYVSGINSISVAFDLNSSKFITGPLDFRLPNFHCITVANALLLNFK